MDHLQVFINSIRGIRENFFSSPFLFLLVSEGLSRLILEAQREGFVRGVRFENSMALPHLLFFDDIMVFGQGNIREMNQTNIIIDYYCKSMGMEVNTNKYYFLFNRLEEDLEGKIK